MEKINALVESLSVLKEDIFAIILLGSQASNTHTKESDFDISLVTKQPFDYFLADKIGRAICNIDKKNNFDFYFHHPICEKCHYLDEVKPYAHLLIHDISELREWIDRKDFVACMWSQSYQILYGEDPFQGRIKPELNDSLLDKFDGLPSFLRDISFLLSTKCPDKDNLEYSQYIKYYLKRIYDLQRFFPESFGNYVLPKTITGRTGILELASIIKNIKEDIEQLLGC